MGSIMSIAKMASATMAVVQILFRPEPTCTAVAAPIIAIPSYNIVLNR